MIDFVSPEGTAAGTVVSMLEEAYGALRDADGARFDAWRREWQEFDRYVYADASLAGNWLFFSHLDGQLVGFVSWDPRKRPVALLGHNCIRPAFQGKGFGLEQLLHALEILREQGFEKVLVQTGREDFFTRARAMYERAGFCLRRNLVLPEPSGSLVVEYELML